VEFLGLLAMGHEYRESLIPGKKGLSTLGKEKTFYITMMRMIGMGLTIRFISSAPSL
jgi:hypothetical protein